MSKFTESIDTLSKVIGKDVTARMVEEQRFRSAMEGSFPLRKILILAKNQQHFEGLMRSFKGLLLQEQVDFLARLPDDLRGLADTVALLYGQYWQRDDFDESQFFEHCRYHNITLLMVNEV